MVDASPKLLVRAERDDTTALLERAGALGDPQLGTAKQLARRAAEAFGRSELLGEVASREAANPATFTGAYDALARRGILELVRAENAREALYVRGSRFEELAGLAERVAGALRAG